MFLRFSEEDYKKLIAKSKYSIKIASELAEYGTLNHQDLCKHLGIKPNNLSNIIRKIDMFDVLFIRKIGKNVYYSLTTKGYEFKEYAKDKFSIAVNDRGFSETDLVFKKI